MDISWVEWEVVSRMKAILETPHPDFEVTHAYASLVPILCWTLQNLRAEERKPESLISTLDGEPIVSEPWKVDASQIRILDGRVEIPEKLSAKWFLVGLRNGVAHGDHHRVTPQSDGTEQNRKLTGFEIECKAHERNECVWRGKVILRQPDMLHLGLELANRFCENFRGGKWRRQESRTRLTEAAQAA